MTKRLNRKRAGGKGIQSSRLNDNATGYLLIAPWIFGFIILYLVPMLASLYFSFTSYNLLSAPKFIGLDNFKRLLFNDPSVGQSLKVTFFYVFVSVPLRLAFALFVAMLLNSKRKFMGVYRAVFYIPSLIGGSVAISIIWKNLFGDKGVLMTLLALVGINQNISLIGNPQTAIWALILLGVWQFGSSMLIFLAALKQIPKSLYEASKIDGATFFQNFIKITLPMLTPVIFFNLVLQMINAFKAFTEDYIVTQGGPTDSTLFYVFNLYRRAFTYSEMGYSCAMAWLLVIIIGVLTALIFKSERKWVYYEKG